MIPTELLRKNKRYSTVKEMAKHYPGMLTESALRWIIFNADKNGFRKCIRTIGRKVLIDLDLFEQWIDNKPRNTKNN